MAKKKSVKKPPAKKPAKRPSKATSRSKAAVNKKSPAEKLVEAMEELTAHLQAPSKCHPMKAYDALPKHHQALFDNLTKAISIRVYGERPEEKA